MFARRGWNLATILVVVTGGIGLWHLRSSLSEKSALSSLTTGYVDAPACAGCHRQIWESYQRTGMARSFTHLQPDRGQEELQQEPTFYHQASDRYYKVYRKDDKYYQRRHQIGFAGQEDNVMEKDVHFVVGSGNHARTYLHRSGDGRIFELPLAWYADQSKHFAMNPGYDHPNHFDFSREITQECIFCHTGYPEMKEGADRFGSELRIADRIPSGIDCQRCHGPGRAHIEAIPSGDQKKIRMGIINPARLPRERQLELCMQCHLETTSTRLPHSILRFNRGAFSFRPGEPLADYVLHFDHTPGLGRDDKFEIAHQAYRLRKSACFQKSNGSLTCTTCHNPHETLKGAAAVEHYTAKCRTCHATGLDVKIAAKKHTNEKDCLTCHMPKRRTDDVVHVVMTDHHIQRTKPTRDLLRPQKERHDTEETAYQGPVVLYYPAQLPETPESELYQAVAQVKQFANLKDGIPRLVAAIERHRPAEGGFYFELAEAYAKIGQENAAIRYYEESTRRLPDFLPARIGLAKALSKQGQFDRGADVLQKALTLSPPNATILNDLGLIRFKQAKLVDAIANFRAATESDPDYADAHNNLAGALLQTGNQAGSEQAYRNAIRIRPDYAEAHNNLANLLASRKFPEAEYHYRKAIYHNPQYAAAHYDYGVALAGAEHYEQAQKQFESALRLNPNRAETHNALADMLALRGKASQAVQHYEHALTLDSELGAAHLGLGTVLASQSRLQEAVSHFTKAAQSNDPPVRAAAQEALQTLKRPADSRF